ncbi:Uncharacterised protein [marine metagenome]
MDNQSEKKRAKLVELKNKLLDGQHVQNRQLKTWLGDDAFEQMEDDWKFQQSIRDDLASPPAEIIEYKKRLQKLTLTYSRAENYSHQKRSTTAVKMFYKSEEEAEKLVEFLHEILQTDLGLQIWFDRSADEDDSGLTPDSLPQVTTSRSRFNQGGGLAMAKQSKQEVKIATIDRAIDDIDELDSPGPTVSEVAANSASLRAIWKRKKQFNFL